MICTDNSLIPVNKEIAKQACEKWWKHELEEEEKAKQKIEQYKEKLISDYRFFGFKTSRAFAEKNYDCYDFVLFKIQEKYEPNTTPLKILKSCNISSGDTIFVSSYVGAMINKYSKP